MNIVRTATATLASTTITLPRTDDLIPGLFAYSSGLPVCTKIVTITDGYTVVLSNGALSTGSIPVTFTEIPAYKYTQRCEAQKGVSEIISAEGMLITLVLRSENDIVRDSYNSIKAYNENVILYLKSYPVIETPNAEELEKAGLRETNIGTIMYFSTLDLNSKGYDFNDIDLIRSTVKYNGETYSIKEKNRDSQFGDIFLYFTLGLSIK